MVIVFLSLFSCLSTQFWLPQHCHYQRCSLFKFHTQTRTLKFTGICGLKCFFFSDPKVNLPGLTNKFRGSQLNSNFRKQIIFSMSHAIFETHSYQKLFVHLKFKFNEASCILSGNPIYKKIPKYLSSIPTKGPVPATHKIRDVFHHK